MVVALLSELFVFPPDSVSFCVDCTLCLQLFLPLAKFPLRILIILLKNSFWEASPVCSVCANMYKSG